MPARIVRSSLAANRPHTKRKRNPKRALDAFSIATEEEPDQVRVRQHRLGEPEGHDSRRKRQRLEQDEGDEADHKSSVRSRQQRTEGVKARLDESDADEGSDSEGNTWRMGEVDEDDDSDIDSDDAFGESDEERFEGFTFRGSSKNEAHQRRQRQRRRTEPDGSDSIDLADADHVAEREDEEDSLGEDAVDLATMLDNYESSNDEGAQSEDESSLAAESDAGEEETDALSKLDAFVSALPVDDPKQETAARRQRLNPDIRPGEGADRPKLSMDAFLAADKNIKSTIPSFKQAKKYTSGKATEVPLPARQRAQLERAAADKKAKETLERWVDTVKHNRRAEHVSFPLVDDKSAEPLGARKLLSVSKAAPNTELESAIAQIMQQNGLTADTNDEEQQLQEHEELQMNKMPIEEVQARRAALRQARDLMFREEIKAKRLKKIKSKAYRRVHRKERERQAMRDADVFGDGEIDEEERERLDRRRAEERMGAKYRDSKWAKAVKKAGKAAWDVDARDGVTDMARRNEELRRRQHGADVSDGDHSTNTDSGDEDFSDDEAARQFYKKSLDNLDAMANGKGTGLSEMKFMKDAEAAKRAQNEEDIKRYRRELNGEDPFGDEDVETRVTGRRQYGPQVKQARAVADPLENVTKSEFEARDDASTDGEAEIIINQDSTATNRAGKVKNTSAPKPPNSGAALKRIGPLKEDASSKHSPVATNPFLEAKRPRQRNQSNTTETTIGIDLLPGEVHSKPDADGFTTVTYAQRLRDSSDASDDEEASSDMSATQQQKLLKQAFAGDDTFEEFTKEKNDLVRQDDDKVVDDSMPGWGSWAGDGLTKRDQRMAASLKQRLQTVRTGVRPQDRKDAKLKNVIISEKKIKKNAQYLAGQLPFPYTTREEYERSMRMPTGGEWNTKSVVQKSTTPRVIVKPGRIITPLEAPLM